MNLKWRRAKRSGRVVERHFGIEEMQKERIKEGEMHKMEHRGVGGWERQSRNCFSIFLLNKC